MSTRISTQETATATATAAATQAGAGVDAGTSTWQIDPPHTQVWFSVRHMMFAKVRGQFPDVTGQLIMNGADPVQVRVEIGAASVDTNSSQRDAHLRSVDFFDVANHPTMTFVSRSVRNSGRVLSVTGDLTIRGVTREVVLEAEETGRGTDPFGQEKIGFSASATIDRRDFGLTWNQALEAGGVLVSDEVKITVDGQAIRA